LTRVAFAAKRHWSYPESWIRSWRADLRILPHFIARHPVYCAVVRERRIGFYALSGAGHEFELEHMWVRPDCIGRGIGRSLFQHATATVRAAGGNRVTIASDPNAEPFYLAMGARRIGTVPSTPEGRRIPLLRLDVS
ncbi:MAG: GNAT family N-acetyltransferase, partial [Candidatus Binatia bacterium]